MKLFYPRWPALLITLTALTAIMTSACAPQVVLRRTVADVSSSGEVEVSMGSEDGLKLGDTIVFFKNDCTRPVRTSAKHGGDASCPRLNVAKGRVVRLIEAAHALVRVDGGKVIESGTFVEKLD